jgi:hypothetical protein
VLVVEWIPIAAWIAAALIAVVLLGFCAYEIIWKARRLQADLRELQTLAVQVEALRTGIADAQQRIAASGLR